MIFHSGVHGVQTLEFTGGPIRQGSALILYDVHTTGTADVAICHFQFASGLVGTLNAYHVTPYRHTLSLYGTEANLYRNDRYFSEGTLLQLQKVSGVNGEEPLEPVPLLGDEDLCGNLRSFHHAIRHGGECQPSLRDGARAVQVVFAAEESARTKKVVKVPELFD